MVLKISSRQIFIDVLKFAVTLTLNTAIQFLQKTLWLMIMYHQAKFGSKRISSSEDIHSIYKLSYFDCMSPYCDLDLEGSKPVFLHNSLTHDGASQYKVW